MQYTITIIIITVFILENGWYLTIGLQALQYDQNMLHPNLCADVHIFHCRMWKCDKSVWAGVTHSGVPTQAHRGAGCKGQDERLNSNTASAIHLDSDQLLFTNHRSLHSD